MANSDDEEAVKMPFVMWKCLTRCTVERRSLKFGIVGIENVAQLLVRTVSVLELRLAQWNSHGTVSDSVTSYASNFMDSIQIQIIGS